MKRMNKLFFAGLLLALVAVAGCDKTKLYKVKEPDGQVSFANVSLDAYTVATASSVYKLKIGTTNISDQDRSVTISVSSPTGAVVGTQYTLSKTTVIIPAGKVLDSIEVKGILAQYTNGRKDTLVFTITQSDAAISTYNSTLKLLVRGPCFDGDIIFSQMAGAYTKTFENGSYGPYTSTVAGLSTTTATTGTGSITNIYDSGITGVATFNWTTLGNFTVVLAAQQVGTLSGAPLFLRTTAPGKFTYCTNAFTIPLELYTAAGTYDAWTMTMAR
jgi:hypothetical protein